MTKLDEKDRQILRVLSRDGRISNLDLAERVSLSPSACLRRVQALEAAGVIAGYRAVLDPAKLGVGMGRARGRRLGVLETPSVEGVDDEGRSCQRDCARLRSRRGTWKFEILIQFCVRLSYLSPKRRILGP